MRRLTGMLCVVLGACGGGDDVGETSNALRVTASGAVVVTLAAIEGGAPLAIGVRLEDEPAEPLVVELASDPLVMLDRTTLTFTAANYDTPQPVVITAVDDGDVIDGAGEIVMSGAELETLVVPIAVADDDEVAIVGAPADVVIMEGASATFGLALGADPGGPVTVTVTSSEPGGATVSPATLTFAADWAVAQTVTVTAPADTDDLDEAVAIDLGGTHVGAVSVPVVVLDVERQNFVIAPAALALVEGGAGGSFTVRLTQAPASPLVIALAMTNPAIAAVAPATLTFTAANHSVPQTVSVTPRADLDGVTDASTVRLTSSGLRDRVVAIDVAEDATADVPAVAGDFLMSIAPGFSNEFTVRYRVSYTIDPVAASLGYSATALRVDDGTPIGDPIVATGVVLAEDTGFAGGFAGLLPGEANPFSGSASIMDAVKLGHIVSPDLLCGTMTGNVSGIDLDGTTWGAVRITGSTLPAPVQACP